MCGLVGFIDFSCETDQRVLNLMSSTLIHRGPDAEGDKLFFESECTIGFAHRRLSIIDLTELGNQPLVYKNFTVVFNGEIYNYKEIKESLIKLNHVFNSESDTEVVLHAYEEWGIDCVSLFIGMFAIVIHDALENKIVLIRDRMGVKPLFYYWENNLFLFSSELKAFHSHPRFKKIIDKSAVKSYFEFGYIPGPISIFKNTFKLDPGQALVFDLKKKNFELSNYWDVSDYFKKDKLDINYSEAKQKIHDLLISSYNYRMVSDVPVGVFLSGGYDSTSVAAIIQKTGTAKKLKTFTIGFEDGNNEAPFANDIANYLGTDHNEWYCTSKIAQEEVLKIPYYFDEPYADSSAIPTLLLSRHAKSQVSVSLSADGGDEIFGGYKVYNAYLKRHSQLNLLPKYSRKSIEKLSNFISKNFDIKNERLKHSLYVLSTIYKTNLDIDPVKLFKSYSIRNPTEIEMLFKHDFESSISAFDKDFSSFSDLLSIPLTIDTKLYLCDDILTKVDRATMACSLEGREPMLDHRLVEFVAQIPSEYKKDKMILKDIVHEYVPLELMNRPKSGFSIPLKKWLKGDFKFLIDHYLNNKSLMRSGIFNIEYIEQIKLKFHNEINANEDLIWKLIQFQMWHEKWFGKEEII